MCQSKAQGGKRCEHGEAYNNAKKRILRKLRKHPSANNNLGMQLRIDLEKFLRDNPDIAYARLPKRETFNCAPASKRPIPEEIRLLLQRERHDAVEGYDEVSRKKMVQDMFAARQRYEDQWDHDTNHAVRHYMMSRYHAVNSFLRSRRAFNDFATETNLKGKIARLHFKDEQDYINEMVLPNISGVDKAFSLVPKDGPVLKTYRLFKVPPGVKPADYVERYAQEGEGFHEKGYMSTSADPEFIVATAMKNNDFKANSQYVVIEIVSNRGMALQPRAVSTPGHIQSQENEVLLPRNSKFRIAGTRKRQKFRFTSDRSDLATTELRYRDRSFPSGTEYTLPVIQLVDETLI